MPAKRILIIDDDPLIREIVHICLTEVGNYEAIEAESGREGLSKAVKEHPDVILLDLCMPHMNGMEVLQQLQDCQATQMIPVVVLSAIASQLNPDQLSTQGVVETIVKPFNCLTLPNRIATACCWNSEPTEALS
jgi:CheY-like chemotaxis protein